MSRQTDRWTNGWKYFHIDYPLSTPWIEFVMALSRAGEKDQGNTEHPFQAQLYSIPHRSSETCKCSQKSKGKRKPSNFPTQKVLPKVHPSTPDSGRNVRGNFQHTPSFREKPEQACTSIRLLQGREECMCLPYSFLLSGKGYGKTRHLHSCCPWSQQPSPRPSLWEMHQIKLNDQ